MSCPGSTRVAQVACGAFLGLISLAVVTATPAAAQSQPGPPTGGSQSGKSGGASGTVFQIQDSIVSPAQTPELSSLVLFGTGAAGMGAYALARLRAQRRRR